ncbi:DUF6286 domain-containing Asp23/Gls24 family envelope stress response protein [Streptomyces zhihengii]|uniref:DUF6286 domain-containing Asp23/Gls24 family envelope stress response protein n=1 Tax=Streptomyces zhihengii TaxID=1818004 RepID=UPI003620A919
MSAPAAQRGTTTVADRVVRRIALRAASEALPGPGAGGVGGSATVHGRRAGISLRIAAPYPATLSDTARRVRAHVADRTGELTGLDVAPVRLSITRLAVPAALPAPAAASLPEAPGGARGGHGGRAPRRWWSARRAPVAVLSLLGAVCCAAVTADVIRVRATGAPAGAWRARSADWLSVHGPGDAQVTAGAVALAAGLWLVLLALAPGRRRQLPLAAASPGWNAAVDRSTVAALLRDTVGDVPGIGAVRVRARRGRVVVTARPAFGDRAEAVRQATSAARRTIADCGLRRTPRLRVRVLPDSGWRPPPGAPAERRRPDPGPGPAEAGTENRARPAPGRGLADAGTENPARPDPGPGPADAGTENPARPDPGRGPADAGTENPARPAPGRGPADAGTEETC